MVAQTLRGRGPPGLAGAYRGDEVLESERVVDLNPRDGFVRRACLARPPLPEPAAVQPRKSWSPRPRDPGRHGIRSSRDTPSIRQPTGQPDHEAEEPVPVLREIPPVRQRVR